MPKLEVKSRKKTPISFVKIRFPRKSFDFPISKKNERKKTNPDTSHSMPKTPKNILDEIRA